MIKHLNIIVTGKVVDVDYRFYAKKTAEELNITGFAKNAGADTVYIEAEGEPEQLSKFVDWCRRGSPWSKVKRVDVSEGEARNFVGFERT